jgi:hypothetical protein
VLVLIIVLVIDPAITIKSKITSTRRDGSDASAYDPLM